MYRNQDISLKINILTVLLLLAPLFIFSQTMTGLWTGVLSNDSNSVRKDQSYEIALTEYRGKVFGYSRAEFIVNDTLYYIVKLVKGVINGDICEVTDDEVLSHNFPKRPEKGVKVSSFFHRNKIDSTWVLDGKWTTNKNKNYYALTGSIALQEEKDLTASKLFPHLEELKVSDDVAFYKESKKEKIPVVMKKVEPEKNTTVENEMVAVNTKPEIKKEPEEEVIVRDESLDRIKEKSSTFVSPAKSGSAAKIDAGSPNSIKVIGSGPQKPVRPEPVINQPVSKVAAIPPPVTENKKPVDKVATAKTTTAAQNPVVKTPEPLKQPVQTTGNVSMNTSLSGPKDQKEVLVIKPIIEPKNDKPNLPPVNNTLPAIVESRKSEFSQYVTFKSDSLELSLYDNGEVDGDTVSLYLNGQVLLSRQCLKATAIKKTIYLTPGKDDEFNLVLYADNLGKYPPNTGLLIVHDGDDVYNLRFSADFEKNAGVLFKRKK